MPRKNYRERQLEIGEIGRLLAMGMVDAEIMKQLKISRSQYYHYRRKLFAQSAEQFKSERIADLGWHKHLLHDRLTKLYRNAELKLQLKKSNSEDPYIESRDYAATVLAAQNLAINIFKLESEGLRILNNFADATNSGNRYLQGLEQPELRVLSDGTTTVGDRERGSESLQSSVTNEDSEPSESEIY